MNESRATLQTHDMDSVLYAEKLKHQNKGFMDNYCFINNVKKRYIFEY